MFRLSELPKRYELIFSMDCHKQWLVDTVWPEVNGTSKCGSPWSDPVLIRGTKRLPQRKQAGRVWTSTHLFAGFSKSAWIITRLNGQRFGLAPPARAHPVFYQSGPPGRQNTVIQIVTFGETEQPGRSPVNELPQHGSVRKTGSPFRGVFTHVRSLYHE